MSLAIRAIEAQTEERLALEGAEALAVRAKFCRALDCYSSDIFSSIRIIASSGERRIFLPTIPGLSDEIDAIFDRGLGMCDPDILNHWLRTRDLSYIFHGSEFTIEW